MSEYNLVPAVDEDFNFPPEVRKAMAESKELSGTIVASAEALVPPLAADTTRTHSLTRQPSHRAT